MIGIGHIFFEVEHKSSLSQFWVISVVGVLGILGESIGHLSSDYSGGGEGLAKNC